MKTLINTVILISALFCSSVYAKECDIKVIQAQADILAGKIFEYFSKDSSFTFTDIESELLMDRSLEIAINHLVKKYQCTNLIINI